MKQTLSLFAFALLFFSFGKTLNGQTVLASPEVWTGTGDHFTGSEIELSFTLGEVMTETFEDGNFILTQGFHQSEDVFLNVYKEKQQQIVITPNSDGLNDALVFEDLLNYPDNEFIVLNRWGGTVFRAQPYGNDWQGTSESGTALPEATYYYLLKLDVGQNELLFGSVTIKR